MQEFELQNTTPFAFVVQHRPHQCIIICRPTPTAIINFFYIASTLRGCELILLLKRGAFTRTLRCQCVEKHALIQLKSRPQGVLYGQPIWCWYTARKHIDFTSVPIVSMGSAHWSRFTARLSTRRCASPPPGMHMTFPIRTVDHHEPIVLGHANREYIFARCRQTR